MKFLFLMVGLPAQPGAADPQTAAYSQKWGEYMSSLAQRGALESGAPLQPAARTVTRNGATETKLETPGVYGYMVVNAGSLDDAIAIAREAPHMALGGSTIVRPCVEIQGGEAT